MDPLFWLLYARSVIDYMTKNRATRSLVVDHAGETWSFADALTLGAGARSAIKAGIQ